MCVAMCSFTDSEVAFYSCVSSDSPCTSRAICLPVASIRLAHMWQRPIKYAVIMFVDDSRCPRNGI